MNKAIISYDYKDNNLFTKGFLNCVWRCFDYFMYFDFTFVRAEVCTQRATVYNITVFKETSNRVVLRV